MGAIVGLALVVGLAGWWWAEGQQRSLSPNSADGYGVTEKQLPIGAEGAGAEDEGEEDDVAAAERQGDVLTGEQGRRGGAQGALVSMAYLIACTVLLTGPNGQLEIDTTHHHQHHQHQHHHHQHHQHHHHQR